MCHTPIFKVPTHLFNSHVPPLSDAFPKVLHQSWKSSSLPSEFQVSQQTCVRANPTYRHVLWTDETNRQFVKNHYPWFIKAFDAYNSNIKRADAARYFYMYHFGGVYADLDVKCFRPFDVLSPLSNVTNVVLGRKGNLNDVNSIPNVVMISKPSSPFWLHVIQRMATRVNCGTPEYDTGPHLLHATYVKDEKYTSVTLLPSDSFYPLDWKDSNFLNISPFRREKYFRNHTFPQHSITYTFWRHSWDF